jgi:hypothetical protein
VKNTQVELITSEEDWVVIAIPEPPVTSLSRGEVPSLSDWIMEKGKKDSRYKTEELEMWQAETLLHMQSSHAIDHTTVLSEHVHPRGEKTYGVSCLYSCGWASHPYYPIILEV